MKRLLLLAVIMFTAHYFISCSCHGLVQCGAGSLVFRTVGFTMTDIDSILLVSYQADGNFDKVIDTQKMYADNGGYGLSHDTCYLDVAAPYGYDYKIIFPTVGVTYNISQMQVSGPSSEDFPYKCEEGSPQQSCFRSVSSFNLNGQAYAPGNSVFTIVR